MPAEGVILSGILIKDRTGKYRELWRNPFGCRRCKAKAESLRQKDRANFHCAYLNRIFGVIYRRSIAFSDFACGAARGTDGSYFHFLEESFMTGFLNALNDIVVKIDNILADYAITILLIACGLFFTFRTKFVQIRCFGEGWRRMFGEFSLNGKKAGKDGMSSFQALTTAIAAQVGTGNIVGACGAILIGGPGAIFWMWVIAFLGMATIYAEATLAQKTKQTDENGEVVGGPVYYIKEAFRGKFGKVLAVFFSIAAILALGLMGAMVQSNSIGESMNNAFGIPAWAVGLAITLLAALIFFGGAKRLASVTEKMVPVMALIYIVGSLAIICVRIKYVPETFGMIFRYAFRPDALIGGGIGYALKTAISQGAKRGLFSNEAGMGSTPHAHAIAKVKNPHEQGVVAMIGVFIDTFVVLTLTALVVISTMYAGHDGLSGIAGYEKTNLAQAAFSSVFGDKIGGAFVAVCLLFFAFSTIISWNYFGRLNIVSLFGNRKSALIIYNFVSLACVFVGSMLYNDLVWNLQDVFDLLLVIPNVIALFALSSFVAKEARRKKELLPPKKKKEKAVK
mgnify:FL=1